MKREKIGLYPYATSIILFFCTFWALVGFVFELKDMINNKGDWLRVLIIFVIFVVLLVYAIRLLIVVKQFKKAMDDITDSDDETADI